MFFRLAEHITKRVPICEVHLTAVSENPGHLDPGMDFLSATPR
jgi:hypothetical protein